MSPLCGNFACGSSSYDLLREDFFRVPLDALDERPVARSPKNRPTMVKNETITLRHVRRRGRARGRGKMLQGERAMATVYHISAVMVRHLRK